MFARHVNFIEDHDSVLNDASAVYEMRQNILQGDVYIARQVVPSDVVLNVRKYLRDIGRCSIPNYCKIEKGSPNFHRVNRWDARAFVRGCFHQFSFFPWNQDVFGLFDIFKTVYFMKNQLSGLRKDAFLGMEPENGCTARLSFQFYPKGIGGLNMHSDPIDYHQLTVPIMVMSRKGEEYQRGGAYVVNENDDQIVLDDLCDYGDVIYFNAQCRHGVETIDPNEQEDWLSFEGRWMLLFAVNKLADNSRISNAVDLGNLSRPKTDAALADAPA